jgi:serine/threonine-protein kinase
MSGPIHDPERFRRIDAVFDAALDIPEPERGAWLERECAGDAALRADVDVLLMSAGTAESLIGENVAEFAAPLFPGLTDEPAEAPLAPGTLLGAWRVLHEIGRGGMGEVYLAERADGAFERTAAIKVVKRGMDTAEVLRRFRAERRILATLDHPNIARLLDGGATPDGRPFIVMEHVAGERIDRWCQTAKLDASGRVRLCRAVCDAVHQAHRRLVVHRDIKPSNVLVTKDGTPKLLDFGIAKLLEDGEADLTSTGVRLFTPEFAAPEQTGDQPVTTATDVYALGRLLNELLAGQRPDGELGTIVQRATAADPTRRYASALQFAEDLDRWLNGMPVMAKPDSFTYRATKFVRRNRAAVAAASAFMLLLIVFAVGMATAQRRTAQALERAERERDTAEEVASLLEDLFDAGDPTSPGTERLDTFRVASLLDRGAARVRDQLGEQPAVQARLLRAIGDAYRGLGLADSAQSILLAAIAIQRTTADSLALAEALNSIALVHLGTSRSEEAEPYLRESFALRAALLPAGHRDIINTLSNLAAARQDQADFEEAAAFYDQALAHIEAGAGADSQYTAVLTGRAVLAGRTGDFATANGLVTRILDVEKARLGPVHSRVGLALNNVAYVRTQLGRLEEADSLYTESVDVLRATVGEQHPWFVASLGALANARARRGLHDQARLLFEEAIARSHDVPQLDEWGLAIMLSQFGDLLVAAGDTAAALVAVGEAVERSRRFFGPEHPNYAVPLAQLARFQCASGAIDEGLRGFDEGTRVLQSTFPPTHPRVLDGRAAYADCLVRAGRLDEAEGVVMAAWEATAGGDASPVPAPARRFATRLAAIADARGQTDQAARWRALADSSAN